MESRLRTRSDDAGWLASAVRRRRKCRAASGFAAFDSRGDHPHEKRGRGDRRSIRRSAVLQMSNDRIVVGIDVGTTKVCALIAEVSEDDHLEVIGVGIVPSRGLKKAIVVNPEEVVESIVRAVGKAEQKSGFKIVSAFVGISGAHISTKASRGIVAVRHPDRQISPDDVQRALEAARIMPVPSDREIVHVLPRHYIVDGQDGIKNPIGMLGHRIEVQTTIVSGAMTSVNNLVRCVERAGIGIDSLVLQPVAAGEAVLTETEREIGVTLIDIRCRTTPERTFLQSSPCYP